MDRRARKCLGARYNKTVVTEHVRNKSRSIKERGPG